MSLHSITDAKKTESYAQHTAQTVLVKEQVWQCCANCRLVKEFVCTDNNLWIPPVVAVVGCAKWDNLPF